MALVRDGGVGLLWNVLHCIPALLTREYLVGFRPIKACRSVRVLLVVAVAWFAIGIFSLIDLQIGEKLYFPVVSYDNTLRTAITAAISRTGVPPQNPYFFPGNPVALRYHYFWFLLCSLIDQAGGALVSPRHAIIAGKDWCGIGLIAIIALYMRFFQSKGPVRLERRMLIAVALLSVTGLDIVPVGIISAITGRLMPTGEGWNGAVMAWVTITHMVAAPSGGAHRLPDRLPGYLACAFPRT